MARRAKARRLHRSGAKRHHPNLETGGETEGVTAGWSDGVAGKEAAEVDDVEAVVDVLHVGLDAHLQFFGAPEIGAEGGINRQGGAHAALGKVHAIHNLLAVLRQGVLLGASELKRKSAAVFPADTTP